MNTLYTALAGRIQQTLTDIEYVVQRAESLLAKAEQTGDDGYWDGIALNLYSFYGGIERIFEDIARTMEQSIPTGTNWHQDLLLQMAAKLNSIRPAVITSATRDGLDEYRGFRHLVRNVYTFQLRPTRLQELVSGLRTCYQNVCHDLETFLQFLEQVADTEP